ncbi:MAG: biotin/lipoyl-containing protein, partial [Acidimicrobiales bacterium]
SLAPMPGGVVRVAVAVGDRVEAGNLLVVLEAMKMEHSILAATAGTVTQVDVSVGDQVETGRVLVVVEAPVAESPVERPGGYLRSGQVDIPVGVLEDQPVSDHSDPPTRAEE